MESTTNMGFTEENLFGGEMPEESFISDDFEGEEVRGVQEEESMPKRRRRKKGAGEADALDEDRFGDGDEPADRNASPEDVSDAEDSADSTQDAAPPGRMRPPRRRRAPALLDVDGSVLQQNDDTGQYDLSILSAARNGRKILTATLDSFEPDGKGMYRAFFYVGKVKVIIPYEEMGLELTGEEDAVGVRLRIDGMLGAQIDYMVRGMDVENLLAGASRRDAMLMRQRTVLNARNRSGDYSIGAGTRCMARILHVGVNYARLEVFGFECFIRIGEISNLWIRDVREAVRIGEVHPVEITELVRGEDGRVTKLRVSMRAAEKQTQIRLESGNTYTGSVVSISKTAYYVNVAGVQADIRCPIKSNYIAGMSVGDYVKFFVRGIYDNVPTGAITKVLKKAME